MSKGAADNKYFMSGFKDNLLQTKVRTALKALSSFMNPKQQGATTAFLQAPFTGTYTSQSAEIMGILKNMRDTFNADLKEARATEKAAKESYDKFMKIKLKAHEEMEASYKKKQANLGGNYGDLASKVKQLAAAEK